MLHSNSVFHGCTITAIFCPTSEDFLIFSETFPGLVLDGAGSSFLCSCEVFYNLICPFCVVLCQVGINFFTLLFDPVFLSCLMAFLILLFISLYWLLPCASCFLFFSSLLLSHISRISSVIHFFFFGRCFPSISMAVSVIAVENFIVSVSRSSPSSVSFRMVKGANFPPIIAWNVLWMLGSFNFSKLNFSLVSFKFIDLSKMYMEGHHH